MSGKPEPRIVDGRGHDFFIIDNPVIDQMIEQIGAKRRADAGWIYTILCRLASNETGEATLRISYLEKKTGRSHPVIIEALKELGRVGLIGVSRNREGGRQGPSTYTILRVSRLKDDKSVSDVQTKQEAAPDLTEFSAYKDSSTKTVTPTGKALASAAPSQSVAWEDSSTGQKQAYLIAYLHQRLSERGLETPTPGYKERLSGEARTFINRGRSKADLLFGLDHIVGRWAEKRLELWQAMGDVDGQSQRRLRAVPDQVPGDVARWKKATTS